MKRLLIIASVLLMLILVPTRADAVVGYLESKDYINTLSSNDCSSDIENFLTICSSQNKDAYFNSGVYTIKKNIVLKDNVSILGDENTVFRGVNNGYQVHLLDDASASNIEIKNMIFDNVTIYSRKSTSNNWIIENNVFLNASKVDTSIDSGLIPDSSNKNGGESTGYYILRTHLGINIKSNMFLRDSSSLGRGIGLYRTSGSTIQDNYFGILSDVDSSIVSDSTKSLKQKVLNLGILEEKNQGYFMTGINVINNDVNTKIIGNHFSFNKDVKEVGYEDGSQSTLGYNRDHFIYAKEYDGLKIVKNYFKGMNKNADGGLKCRNGNDLLIHKNVFEDSMILLYVQTGSTKYFLTNVLISENYFINKDYSSERLNLYDYTSGSGTLNKYLTLDYLILFKNYVSSAVVNNITIKSNVIYSKNKGNEEIRIDNTGYNLPTNLNIIDNFNIINENLRIKIWSTAGFSNQTLYTNFLNGQIYDTSVDDYSEISKKDLLNSQEVDFEIRNKKIVTNCDIYLDGKVYDNEDLSLSGDYLLAIIEDTLNTIRVEDKDYSINSSNYTLLSFKPEILLPKKIEISKNENIDLSEYFNFKADIELLNNSDICIVEGTNLTGIKDGEQNISLSIGGFIVEVNVVVDSSNQITDFEADDIKAKLSQTPYLVLNYDETKDVDFVFDYDDSIVSLDENLRLEFKKTGSFNITIKEMVSNITKSINVIVEKNNLEYSLEKNTYLVDERFELKILVNGIESANFNVEGLKSDNNLYYCDSVDSKIWIIDSKDASNRISLDINIKHYYNLTIQKDIVVYLGKGFSLDYSLSTSNKDYKITYEINDEYLSMYDTVTFNPKKVGSTDIKIIIDGNEIDVISVQIIEKDTFNYSYLIIGGIIISIMAIFVIIIVLRKRLWNNDDRQNKIR